MKTLHYLLVLLFTITISYAANPRVWTPDDQLPDCIPSQYQVSTNVSHTIDGNLLIRLTFPLPQSETVTYQGVNYTSFTSLDGNQLAEEGSPLLPAVNRVVRLPDYGNVAIQIRDIRYREVSVDFPIVPAQPMHSTDNGETTQFGLFTKNDERYSSNEWYPSNQVQLSEPALLRDARIAVMQIIPIQVNPVTQTARSIESIDLEIVSIGGLGLNERSGDHKPVKSFAPFYREILGCDDLADDADNAPLGKILVICRNDSVVLSAIKPFTDWKTLKGHPVQYITYAPTAAVYYNQLRTQIEVSYHTANPPLEQVVLFGDDGLTGANNLPPANSYSDHGYSQIVGNDILADVMIGRFSFTNEFELRTMVNRSVNYEKNPFVSDTTWFTRGWGLAGYGNSVYSNRTAMRFCLEQMNLRGIVHTTYDEYLTAPFSANTIVAQLEHGAIFWAHRGYNNNDLPSLSLLQIMNVNRPFFCFNTYDNSGDWAGSSTSPGEHFIRLGTPGLSRGAVATVGSATSSGGVPFKIAVATGMGYGFGTLKLRQPGAILLQGKFNLWQNFRINQASRVNDFSYNHNLIGDPTVSLWTGVPRPLSVTIPESIPVGQNRLSFQVTSHNRPVGGMTATAWLKDSTGAACDYSVATSDAWGNVVLSFENQVRGNLFLAVVNNQSDGNYIPFVDTIAIIEDAQFLTLGTIGVDDDVIGGTTGNDDGFFNPGETVELHVPLINNSILVRRNISGQLLSPDPRVEIQTGTRVWTTIAPSDSALPNAPFRVHLAPTLSHGDHIELLFRVIMPLIGIYEYSIPITIQSMSIDLVSQRIQDIIGNEISLQPDSVGYLSLTIRNTGFINPGVTTGNLSFNSPHFSVFNNAISFASLPLGQSVTTPLADRFTFSYSPRLMPGSQVTAILALESDGYRDTVIIPLSFGHRATHHPTGPDPYGYYAFDNRDTSYSISQEFQWIEILPSRGGDGIRLDLPDGSDMGDSAVAVALPFPVQYYGVVYDTITVCSNGWFAFGWQPYYNNFRNWHLPAQEGPRSMVAVFWDDLICNPAPLGVFFKFDSDSSRFILTWMVQTLFGGNAANEFQAVIYDQTVRPTATRDAMILCQYKTFSNVTGRDNDYATIGISDHTRTRGLEYSYWNTYTPGSSVIANSVTANRAILFTTYTEPRFGSLEGTVTFASNHLPVLDAGIQIDGNTRASTDASGHYRIQSVTEGNRLLGIVAPGCNSMSRIIQVLPDSTLVVNIEVTQPMIHITPDSVYTIAGINEPEREFPITIRNDGNGLLTWNSQFVPIDIHPGIENSNNSENSLNSPRKGPVQEISFIDEIDEPWQELFSFNGSVATSDSNLMGVEFDGNNFWVTGENDWTNPNRLYKFSRNGVLLATFNQTDTTTAFGWRDLAWDGRYLYASGNRFIDVIDTMGNVVSSITSNVNPARCIAIDTVDHELYYCDRLSQIYVIDYRTGQTIRMLVNLNNLYGLAWNPYDADGMRLYAFARDANGNGAYVYRIDPATGTTELVRQIGGVNEIAAGCAITTRWNTAFNAFIGLLVTDSGTDRIAAFDIGMNREWVYVTPHEGAIQPGDSSIVTLRIISHILPIGNYRLGLQIRSNAIPSPITIPVALTKTSTAPEPLGNRLPERFSLEPNFPNPFNAFTTIRFQLPKQTRVSIILYNAIGEEAAKLVNEEDIVGGEYRVKLDARSLPSGIYFCRMVTLEYSATRKIVLLK